MADIKDVIEDVVSRAEQASDRLISVIALLVAVLATVMALFNIKAGNVVQAMAQAQASSLNAWAYFQAKSTKQGLAESLIDQLSIERERRAGRQAQIVAALDKTVALYRDKVSRYEREKNEIKAQAEAYEREYDRLSIQDDQLDVAEASINIAIAVLGIAALTRRKWLVWFALTFAGVGLVSGVAGFVGGGFHLDFVARMLG